METLDYDSSPKAQKWNTPTYWSTFAMYTCVGWMVASLGEFLFHLATFRGSGMGLAVVSAIFATPLAMIATLVLRQFRPGTGIAVAILLGLLPTPVVFAVGCFLAR